MAGWRRPGLHSSSATPPFTSDTRRVAPRSRTAARPTRTPGAEAAQSRRVRRRAAKTTGLDSGSPATARLAQNGPRGAQARSRLAELGSGLEERRALDGAGPVVFEKDQGRPGDRLRRRSVLGQLRDGATPDQDVRQAAVCDAPHEAPREAVREPREPVEHDHRGAIA